MFVFINPGHALGGDPDPGCVNEALGLRECDIAMTVGSLMGNYLQQAGCKVELLQSHNLGGESPEYPCVTDEANRLLSDIFISIHVNAGGGRGPETYCYWQASEAGRLAVFLQRQLIMSLSHIDHGYCDRGIKENKSFCVLRKTLMPAVLVELGFIDSADVALLKNNQDDMARALARGVTDYWQTLAIS